MMLASLALSLPLMAGFALGGPARAATLPLAPSVHLASADRPAECYYYHRHHHHHHRHHWRRY